MAKNINVTTKVEQQKMQESAKRLRSLASMSMDEVYNELETKPGGMDTKEAEERLDENGPNVITGRKTKGPMRRLLDALVNPFNLVLLFVAVVSGITEAVVPGDSDYSTVIIIVALVVLASLMSFIQGERSNKAAERLSDMISNKADVVRDGQAVSIDIDDIVVGDIVKLSAGDMIPADVRFVWTKDCFVAQASLTGESNPVEKFYDHTPEEDSAVTDIPDLGFMGSNIISGTATAIVLETGNETFIGSMARSISGNRSKNSFEKGVDSVSKLLIRFMIVMVPIIFVINGATKGDWLEALLFSITIAVGLTPEMLPMIMTSTLATGAVRMSKKKTIVKSLSAIQTFGEMDILCTDKTGTLTEDKIILEKYMDVMGNDDQRVLRHAFLNSYFQTGLKNLLDVAVIARADKQGLDDLTKKYVRQDEIPFDFSRRRMSVVLRDKSGKTQLITKGAVEEVMSICSMVDVNGEVKPLDDAARSEAMKVYERENGEGLRVIAVAQKNEVSGIEVFGAQDESDMVLLGFIGFLDPPKESAKGAIEALNQHGVRVVVLTGDSAGVAYKVCGKVGVNNDKVISGAEVEDMDDMALIHACESCDIFAKLSPQQKQRVVETFQEMGHTVGYMGDGINDAPPMHSADVGISVDSAVDIAKETADIVLLEKDLMVLEQGVVEGRRTFGNIIKYIKMATSGNFGNVFSVLIASIFLPFLPMLPIQILVQNLLCDISQIGIPFDSVDPEYLMKPRKWDARSIQRFMLTMGPVSSLFDTLCFAVLWFVIGANTMQMAPLFRCGWFIFGSLSQVFIVYMIRTRKLPFIQSRPALPLLLSTIFAAIVALIIGFGSLAKTLDMTPMTVTFIPWLVVLLIGYAALTELVKRFYVKKFGEWV